jgi:hypothetical protein
VQAEGQGLQAAAHDFVDGIGRERLLEAAGAVVLARTEQGTVLVLAMPGGLEVIVDKHARRGVPHIKVAGKGEKTRYLPLHPGTNERNSANFGYSSVPALIFDRP